MHSTKESQEKKCDVGVKVLVILQDTKRTNLPPPEERLAGVGVGAGHYESVLPTRLGLFVYRATSISLPPIFVSQRVQSP
jgi:hypothetical protein